MSHSPRSYSIPREMKHAETSSPHILDKWLSHYTLILNIHVQFPQSTLLGTNADCTWSSGLINYTEVALVVYLCKCISVLCKCDTRQLQALNYRLQVSTSHKQIRRLTTSGFQRICQKGFEDGILSSSHSEQAYSVEFQ